MKAASNGTVVRGRLLACEPADDGYGSHVEIEVAGDRPQPQVADFIQAAPGSVLRAFLPPDTSPAKAAQLVGSDVEAMLTWLGGPRGGQAVVQTLRKSR